MIELFIRLELQLQDGKPFALYAKPGSNTVTAVFQKDTTPYTTTDFEGSGFVFAPFATGVIATIPFAKADVFNVISDAESIILSSAVNPPADSAAKAQFEHLVSLCVSEIKSGKFDKLVASRTEFVDTDKSIAEIFTALLSTYPNAFRYCFFHPASGLWMGATPEQLLKAENRTIHTVALAGTQLYSPDAEAVWETKEKDEQQFVTDYIVNTLQEVAGNVSVSTPYTFRAGNIVHIKTDISAVLSHKTSLSAVIEKLHPTPAVCGLPKEAARDFLIAHEGYGRAYYSGFLGELNRDGKSDLFVNLRSMKMEQGKAQLFIGCGITKDSNPEKEFYETVNKSMTMRKTL